jgi:glutamyl-tRNA synthetase
LAQWVARFVNRPVIDEGAAKEHFTDSAKKALGLLADKLEAVAITAQGAKGGDNARLDREAIAGCVKATLAELNLKMPQLAMPARLAVFGTVQTPSLDGMLGLLPGNEVLERLHGVS